MVKVMLKLSIVIPYYKTLDRTQKLLTNLCKQAVSGIEIIVVDDGCDEKELDKYPVKVIHQRNGGVSKARNTGLNIAKGEYIAFIDSDDQVVEDYIQKILNKINTTTFDYCYFSFRATGRINKDIIITTEPPEWNTCVWNCVYNRATIGKTRFDENKQISEDTAFNEIVRKGKRENISDILYFYEAGRPGSLTQQYDKGEIEMAREEETIETGVVIYRTFLSLMGGIETAIYNLALNLKDDYDVVFMYDTADIDQLKRLRKLIKCVRYTGQPIKCDTFVYYGFNVQTIDQSIEAKEVVQHICCDVFGVDFRGMPSPKTTRITADSRASAESFMRMHNRKDCEVLHNLFLMPEKKRILHLMTASRLSWEKGYGRMKVMAKRMNELNVPFTWEVFANENPDEDIEGMIFRKPRLEITELMNNKDYGIQLSESESWGCTTTEFLMQGIPMVCTDYPSSSEQVKDGVNGYILKRDMSNLDDVIHSMYEHNLKGFEYNADFKKEWIKILGEPNKKYDYEWRGRDMVEIKALRNYTDVIEGRMIHTNERYIATEERAERIIAAGYAEKIRTIEEAVPTNVIETARITAKVKKVKKA